MSSIPTSPTSPQEYSFALRYPPGTSSRQGLDTAIAHSSIRRSLKSGLDNTSLRRQLSANAAHNMSHSSTMEERCFAQNRTLKLLLKEQKKRSRQLLTACAVKLQEKELQIDLVRLSTICEV